MRSTRPIDVGAFGNIKQNKGLTRFMLRGLEKVSPGIGLLSTLTNRKKWARIIQGKAMEPLPDLSKSRSGNTNLED